MFTFILYSQISIDMDRTFSNSMFPTLTYSLAHVLPCIQQSGPQQPPSILSDLLITDPALQLGSLPSLILDLEQQTKRIYSQSQSEEV